MSKVKHTLKKDLTHLKELKPSESQQAHSATILDQSLSSKGKKNLFALLDANSWTNNGLSPLMSLQSLGVRNEFNLFSHHKNAEDMLAENYETLKEALLELYLSVKIRSDEEIDGYTEEQFKIEKH
jgi:hypothetical protein